MFSVVAFPALATMGNAEEVRFSSMFELPNPVLDGAREPSLSSMSDGRVLLSWTEPRNGAFAVLTSIGDGAEWSIPNVVVEADDLFVNWADFPSAIALPDGKLVAHWLQVNGDTSYQYDVAMALSDDEGKTWGEPFFPHDDRSQREHGFVSLLAGEGGEFSAIWLDGRSYDTYGDQDVVDNAMQLRARSFSTSGAMSEETLLDARTCTCCQTSAALTDKGTTLAVYRDRSADEIRDIAIVRKTGENWSTPKIVAVDGWHIEGCPVNGPAIASRNGETAVAWFTAARNVATVNVAFSVDDGVSFGTPFRIDNGAPSGRVDVTYTADGAALVTWVEQSDRGEAIMMCQIDPETGCSNPFQIAVSPSGRTVGFPRMSLGAAGMFIAWTEPSGQPKTNSEGGTTIRTFLLPIGDAK